ncbi:MAG: hypothetical protein AABZ32_04345, partial [Bacteroidota bacterium]
MELNLMKNICCNIQPFQGCGLCVVFYTPNFIRGYSHSIPSGFYLQTCLSQTGMKKLYIDLSKQD